MNEQMPDCTALLQSILDVTRKMRESALESDWESVQQNEKYRQTLIGQCFPLQQPIEDPGQASSSIHEVIEMDRSVMSLLAAAREELAAGLGKLKLGRQAANAYTAVVIGGQPDNIS